MICFYFFGCNSDVLRLSAKRVADSKFECRTIDCADLDFRKQPFALGDAGEKIESGPDIGVPVSGRPGTEDIGCRATPEINVPRVLSEGNPIGELCVQCNQGNAVA